MSLFFLFLNQKIFQRTELKTYLDGDLWMVHEVICKVRTKDIYATLFIFLFLLASLGPSALNTSGNPIITTSAVYPKASLNSGLQGTDYRRLHPRILFLGLEFSRVNSLLDSQLHFINA